jgi:hypothetical protein
MASRAYDAACAWVEGLLNDLPSSSAAQAVAQYAGRIAARATTARQQLRHRCRAAGVAPEYLDQVCGSSHKEQNALATHRARDPEAAPRDARMSGEIRLQGA